MLSFAQYILVLTGPYDVLFGSVLKVSEMVNLMVKMVFPLGLSVRWLVFAGSYSF